MRNILIAMLATLALGTVAADAAARHKHKRIHPTAPLAARTAPASLANRPAWANPNECRTDEGYGRFWQCGAGKSN